MRVRVRVCACIIVHNEYIACNLLFNLKRQHYNFTQQQQHERTKPQQN